MKNEFEAAAITAFTDQTNENNKNVCEKLE